MSIIGVGCKKQRAIVVGVGARRHGRSLFHLAAEQRQDALLQAGDRIGHQGEVSVQAGRLVALRECPRSLSSARPRT